MFALVQCPWGYTPFRTSYSRIAFEARLGFLCSQSCVVQMCEIVFVRSKYQNTNRLCYPYNNLFHSDAARIEAKHISHDLRQDRPIVRMAPYVGNVKIVFVLSNCQSEFQQAMFEINKTVESTNFSVNKGSFKRCCLTR